MNTSLTTFDTIHKQIINSPSNAVFTTRGWKPVYTASESAKLVIIGQAPGLAAQESEKPWNDVSGESLRRWLGISDEQFYDKHLVSLLPMDFYFPGKNPKGGDLPPRIEFASEWHPKLLSKMPKVQLILLVGSYSQRHYLADESKRNLTENVRAFKEYLPVYFPLVHPSPLTIRWRSKNPWFENNVLPVLKEKVMALMQDRS